MTLSQLKKLPTAKVRRIAANYFITVPRDFTKADIIDCIADRLGEDKVAWKLLDQYLD